MGKLIGIWSPYSGTGRTTIALAVAYKIAELDKDKRILVCCANGANSTLIKTIGISSEEVGLEDLVNFRLAGFVFGGYETMFARKGRISFLGSSKMTPNFSKMFVTEFYNIFKDFRQKFDICIVDLPCGKENILGSTILSGCDKSITVLKHDAESVSLNKLIPAWTRENIVIVNEYNKEYPEIHYNINGGILEVPYCELLCKMRNKGKLFQYFSLKTDFCNSVENIASIILGLRKNKCYVNKPADVNGKFLRHFKINIAGGQQG